MLYPAGFAVTSSSGDSGMKKWAITFGVAFAAMWMFTGFACAQDSPLRDPTPAEKKVLENYTEVIHSFLDTFETEDWDMHVDFDVDDQVLVGKRNEVPLDVDELIQRTYTVKNGSPLYN